MDSYMGPSLRQRLTNRISDDGPLPFDEYMAACLYDPSEGFFASGPLRSSEEGDFVTSPEISPYFGALVGRWAKCFSPLAEERKMTRVEREDLPILAEVGAVSGSLLGPLVAEVAGVFSDVYAVEVSRAARIRIAQEHPMVAVVASFDEIPGGVDAVLVVNEMLDNMPAALARSTDDGWVEVGVDVSGGGFTLSEMPARREVIEWCDEVFWHAPAGTVVTVQLAVDQWVTSVFDRFGRVSLCLIDYAASAEELVGRSAESLIRSYRRHRTGLDWLQSPGDTDITVDVNIDGVTRAVQRAGRSARVVSQSKFLQEQGVRELMDETRQKEEAFARKGEIMEQLKARSERVAVEALVDPSGLGGFTVVLVEEDFLLRGEPGYRSSAS